MRDVRACRCCLSTKSKLIKISPSAKTTYFAISGIPISEQDGYPMNFCIECYTMIRKIQSFRRKCRRAYFVLKEIMIVKKEVPLSSIDKVDRDKTNLNSLYDFSTGNKHSIYHATDLSDIANKTTEHTKVDTENNMHGNFNLFAKVNPEFINERNIILIDIKSDLQELEEQEIDKEDKIEISEYNSVQGEEFDNNDGENLVDIDLEDVFKGLEEKQVESEEELSEPEIFKKKVKRKKLESKTESKVNKDEREEKENIKELCEILETFEIRRLNSLEEQDHGQKMRMEQPLYKLGSCKCSVCVKTFTDKDELVNHCNEHARDVILQYLCKICKLRLKTEQDLEIHTAVTHLYEYSCTICGAKKYTLEDVLQCAHLIEKPNYIQEAIKKHFTRKSLPQDKLVDTLKPYYSEKENTEVDANYFCNQCKMELGNRYLFERHQWMHFNAKNKSTPTCEICGTSYNSTSYLARHMEYNHLYIYTCKHCNVELFNRFQLVKHKCLNNMKTTTCGVCKRSFKNLTSLAVHQTATCNKKTSKNWCNLCGHFYNTRYRLFYHQLKVHQYLSLSEGMTDGDPEANCDHCQIQFLNKDAFTRHLTSKGHDRKKQKKKQVREKEKKKNKKTTETSENEVCRQRNFCRKCKKMYTITDEQPVHVCKVSENKQQCFYCNEVFDTIRGRDRHMVRTHNMTYKGEKKYKLCDICGVSVPLHYTTYHKNSHAKHLELINSNWDACKYCFRKFTSLNEIVRHMIKQHTNKPYMCALCPAMYKHRHDCRDHILKVHAPVRLYKCETCQRDFSHIDYLRAHCQKMHGYTVPNTKRVRCAMFVYPFMKLNCTLLEPAIIEKWQLKICDFLDEKCKPVDNIMDHAVFDPALIPEYNAIHQYKSAQVTPSKKKRSKRKKGVALTDSELVVNKVEDTVKESDIDFKDKSSLNFERVDMKIDVDDCARTKKVKIESKEKIEIEDSVSNDIAFKDDVELDYVQEETVIEDSEMTIDYLEDDSEEKKLPDEYEVFEDGRHQYVKINGVLYRIENP